MAKTPSPGSPKAAEVPDAPDAPGSSPSNLYEQPGHLIRRAHQIAVSMFLEAVDGATTPLQYAILRTLQDRPGIDQVTLAQEIALDNSTTAETAVRLEGKGLIERRLLPRRQRSLHLTVAGEQLLRALVEPIDRMHEAMLANLNGQERREFMRLLSRFVDLNNDQSRAPRRRNTAA